MNFNNGMKVKVCSDEDGFQGAWFPGTIIGHVANAPRPKFFVQYDNFITNKFTQEPLVEELFLEDIRPRPPIISLP